jgi:NhaP-type Na+/H+ or K+/H+ antiporter
MRDIVKVLFLLSISFLFIESEHQLQGIVPFSALLSIMSMGIVLKKYEPTTAKALSMKYNELWVAAEILLFTLVGAAVNLDYAKKAGLAAVLLIVGALLFRMVGVALSLVKTNLSKKERIFSMFAYSPKATVQAAIGAIPLSMGLACGEQVLTAAVLAILVTAPFGAICIDKSYQKLLSPPEK